MTRLCSCRDCIVQCDSCLSWRLDEEESVAKVITLRVFLVLLVRSYKSGSPPPPPPPTHTHPFCPPTQDPFTLWAANHECISLHTSKRELQCNERGVLRAAIPWRSRTQTWVITSVCRVSTSLHNKNCVVNTLCPYMWIEDMTRGVNEALSTCLR